MNAPATAGAFDAVFEHLPLTSIAPSETPSQVRRRKRYTPEALAEFTTNIRAIGVMEPVIVRPLKALRDLANYELVAGERRWLSAKAAGLAHIPALVRDIADEDLALFQLSENVQRESIAPLEEAEALREIMESRKLDAEVAGNLIGKSRTHVYNRLKLLQGLKHPAAIDALESGRLDPGKALLVARIPTMKLQLKALEIVADDSISLRRAGELLRDKLMVRLDAAPFGLDDQSFRTGKPGRFPCQDNASTEMPSCEACRHCSSADPELNEQVIAWYGDGARACTDKPCYDFKVQTFFEHRIADARNAGIPILEGAEAMKIRANSWSNELIGYIDLDANSDQEMPEGLSDAEQTAWEAPTYRTLLGDDAKVAAILIDARRDGQPRELMAYSEAKKALKKKGIKLAPEPEQQETAAARRAPASQEEIEQTRREDEAQKERQEKELAFRRRVGALIFEKWKGKLTRDDWELIAEECLNSGAGNMIANALFSGEINLTELNERELQALCMLAPHAQTLSWHQSSPGDMLALAKRLKIDTAKCRKEPKDPAAEKERPGAKKTKKKARK